MIKIILIGVVVVGVTYIGYGISRFYFKRKRYFEELILLAERLSVDISFSKDNLLAIFSRSGECFSGEFKKSVLAYMAFLKNSDIVLDEKLLFGKSHLIKPEEKEIILLFFKSLGRLDVSNQVTEIQNFKEKFAVLNRTADDENKKFGVLAIKLALLFGLLIVILII